jgi:superfamily II DNA or RNA helicase
VIDLLDRLTDADLRRRFGGPTVDRALGYARGHHVIEVHESTDGQDDWIVRARVAGGRPTPYDVVVDLGPSRDGVWVSGRCTCPMVADCKHVVAVVLHLREGDGAPRRPRWEWSLDHVLDELEGQGAGAGGETPLGLLVDLAKPVVRGYREHGSGSGSRGSLRIRPVRPGARDNWVRTHVSWLDLPGLRARGFRADHVALLEELQAGYRAASRSGYYGAEDHLPLASFGASLWGQLARADELGIALVAGPGLSAVAVADSAARLEVDANTDGVGAVHLEIGAHHETEWYTSADLELLGSTGHGVALWQDGDALPAVILAPLATTVGPQIRRLVASRESIVVPAGSRDELLGDYLPRLSRHLDVASSDGSVDIPERPLPRLALRIEWRSVAEVSVAWFFRYPMGQPSLTERVSGGGEAVASKLADAPRASRHAAGVEDRSYALDDERGFRGVRDRPAEQDLLDGLVLTDEQRHRLCTASGRLASTQQLRDAAAIGLAEILPELVVTEQFELEEIGARPDYREAIGAPVIRFEARDEVPSERPDWLDLEVIVSVEGQFVGLAVLLEALTLGRERIIMPNGVHIRLDHPKFAQLAELVAAAAELEEQPRDGIAVHRGDLGLWDELADLGIVDAQASQWVRAAQALRGLVTLPDVVPTGVDAALRPYQREGFRWLAFLWESGLGGILADDMGLGKTLQTLALIAHARDRGAAPFLVVAPTSVVSTWAHEAAAFTPGLRVHTVTESHARRGVSISALHEEADLVITSYTLYRLEASDYVACEWGGLVLDEAQSVKNHEGKTHQAVRRLDVPFRVALSGTPMENRLMELWSLLSIVAPGLYPYPKRFAELVANPVEKEGDAAVLDRFRRRIRPFLLRRTKDVVASDLPPKQEQVLDVQLTARHRKIYETHLQRERQTVLGLVGDFERHRIAIFRSLTRLRQLSLDAGLVDPAYDGVGSAKIDVLVDHLQEVVAEGHRALVFSQFTSFLTRVRERLDREGIDSKYLDGRTRKRAEVIDDFKQGSASVFLISLKAGGVGLTLTEADYVFVLDPWWNPAVEAQAVDRAHRIGQKRPVMVYRLVSERTIEEKVMELKARKAALFAKVVDGDGTPGTPITADDVRALFED